MCRTCLAQRNPKCFRRRGEAVPVDDDDASGGGDDAAEGAECSRIGMSDSSDSATMSAIGSPCEDSCPRVVMARSPRTRSVRGSRVGSGRTRRTGRRRGCRSREGWSAWVFRVRPPCRASVRSRGEVCRQTGHAVQCDSRPRRRPSIRFRRNVPPRMAMVVEITYRKSQG